MLISLAVGLPTACVLGYIAGRRLQSLPFARRLAAARGGDMRGIALQTIIIMVVLLAIAGAVAAVLFNRAAEETQALEDSEDVSMYAITSPLLCRTGGFTWVPAAAMPGAGTSALEGLTRVGITDVNRDPAAGVQDGDGYCEPSP
ncbi:MAG: hypothetical protein OXU42_16175 [Deltaproteobacteria bacterium]|nr:hypothetical protein [Deltaproteobacteria bacterium]